MVARFEGAKSIRFSQVLSDGISESFFHINHQLGEAIFGYTSGGSVYCLHQSCALCTSQNYQLPRECSYLGNNFCSCHSLSIIEKSLFQYFIYYVSCALSVLAHDCDGTVNSCATWCLNFNKSLYIFASVREIIHNLFDCGLFGVNCNNQFPRNSMQTDRACAYETKCIFLFDSVRSGRCELLCRDSFTGGRQCEPAANHGQRAADKAADDGCNPGIVLAYLNQTGRYHLRDEPAGEHGRRQGRAQQHPSDRTNRRFHSRIVADNRTAVQVQSGRAAA